MKNFNVTSMLVMLMFMCITSMQAQSITPSKKYITKELNNVSNFSSIRVLGSPDVEYRQSSDSKTTVSIYGSDNLVDLLEVSTVNGVLPTPNGNIHVYMNSKTMKVKATEGKGYLTIKSRRSPKANIGTPEKVSEGVWRLWIDSPEERIVTYHL